MPEWSIGAVSKTVVPLRVPRVRIPAFPQKKATLGVAFVRSCRRCDPHGVRYHVALTVHDSPQQVLSPFGYLMTLWSLRLLSKNIARILHRWLRGVFSLSMLGVL